MKKEWWQGKGFSFGAGLFAFFAIGSSSIWVRLFAVSFVGLFASLQGFVDGCEAGKK